MFDPVPILGADSPAANPAIARCYAAFDQLRQEHMAKGVKDSTACLYAREAYRNAIPALSSAENIRDFIACVAHGILAEMISEHSGARLLYAAQVARGALAPLPKPKKDTPSPLPSTVSSPQTGEETA